MSTKTVVCPECGGELPYGRLSCPSCGALLASVAGAAARPGATTTAQPAKSRRKWRSKGDEKAAETAQPVAAAAPHADAAGSAGPGAAPSPAAPFRGLAPSRIGAVTLAARLDPSADSAGSSAAVPGALGTPAVLADWPAPSLGGASPWRRDGVQRPHDLDRDDEADPGSAGNGHAGVARPGTSLPAWAGGPRSAEPQEWPAPPAASASATTGPPPGSYLPPSGHFTARDSGLPRGQLGLPADARSARTAQPAWPGQEARIGEPARADEKPRVGVTSRFADLPFETPDSLPGWLVAAGAAASIAGFLLPWSNIIPFATGFGYLDRWGLATPSHLLILLGTAFTLALAILPNRVPVWLRSGVLGLVLGGLILGIVWPYMLDGFGALLGALAEVAGAGLMIAGGVLAVRDRHAEDEAGV